MTRVHRTMTTNQVLDYLRGAARLLAAREFESDEGRRQEALDKHAYSLSQNMRCFWSASLPRWTGWNIAWPAATMAARSWSRC